MLEGTLIWKIEHISLILQPFLSGDDIPLVNKIQIESNKFQDNLLTEHKTLGLSLENRGTAKNPLLLCHIFNFYFLGNEEPIPKKIPGTI